MRSRSLPGPIRVVDAAVRIPTSKSLTNRALIASAAAGGGTIRSPLDCEDTRLLAEALAQAGWPVRWDEDIVIAERRSESGATVDLGNSGTGSRLIVGLLACVPGRFRVDGTPRLRERPMRPLVEALADLGSEITSREGFLPIEIGGGVVPGGAVVIRPGVSSQFVSSLLLAGPLMTRGLDLTVTGRVPSRPYLDLTSEVLEAFGATVELEGETRWRVSPGGLKPVDYAVEGDWSAVAFPAAAAAVVGGSVAVGPLSPTSSQGDRALCDILRTAGVEISVEGSDLVFTGPASRPFEADLTSTPDLFPALAVVAAGCPPGSVLRGLDHLKHKESDRLTVMIENLGRLGAVFDRTEDGVAVSKGIDRGPGPEIPVTAADDHRIAMAMAVAGLAVGGLVLDDDGCVGKSFPGFWRMWEGLLAGSEAPP
jgi:3-phosphoshikimate 1-carboxyvinyltransferase